MSKLDTSQILKCQGERKKKKKKYRPSKADVALFPLPEICVEKPDWSRVKKKKKFRKRSQKEIKVEFQLKKKKRLGLREPQGSNVAVLFFVV